MMSFSSEFRLVVGSETYRAADILSGVTIAWGRGSLYDTPQKRALTAEIKTPLAGLFDRARDLTGRTATAYLGDTILFTGTLADLTTRRLTPTHAALKFSSHETVGMNPLLEEIVNTNASSAGMLRKVIPTYVPKLRVNILDIRPDAAYIRTGGFADIQVKRLCEALACPASISRPAWSPDYKTVRSTIYRLPRDGHATVDVPADAIGVDAPSFSLRNFPAIVHYKMGTIYGAPYELNQLRRWPLAGIIDVDIPVSWDDFSDYDDDERALESAQISDPLSLKFSDARTPDRRLFRTWENPEIVVRTSKFTRDRSPLLGGADSLECVLIGGQLTFTADEVTHNARAVYTKVTGRVDHHTYEQLPGSYQLLPGLYQEQ